MDVTSKVAIITGGAMGLGKGFAGGLLQRGATVRFILFKSFYAHVCIHAEISLLFIFSTCFCGCCFCLSVYC